MPVSSWYLLCASMLIFRFTFHIYTNSSFIYGPPPPSGCFPVSPHRCMSANTMYTSFLSPAFLCSQPPTVSLFSQQISRLVPSLTSQVSNPSYSFPHQTFQRLSERLQALASPILFSLQIPIFIFLTTTILMLSTCCLYPLGGLPRFPPPLASVTPILWCLPFQKNTFFVSACCLPETDAYFVFERAPVMLWA